MPAIYPDAPGSSMWSMRTVPTGRTPWRSARPTRSLPRLGGRCTSHMRLRNSFRHRPPCGSSRSTNPPSIRPVHSVHSQGRPTSFPTRRCVYGSASGVPQVNKVGVFASGSAGRPSGFRQPSDLPRRGHSGAVARDRSRGEFWFTCVRPPATCLKSCSLRSNWRTKAVVAAGLDHHQRWWRLRRA